MEVIGNVLLAITTIIYIGIIDILYFTTAPRGGDYTVGYSWSILILHGAFIICFLLVAIIMAALGKFYWVGSNSSSRFFIVAISLVCTLVTMILCGLSKDEKGIPLFIQQLSAVISLIIPPVLIITSFIMMNKIPVPANVYKISLIAVTTIGITGCIAFWGAFTYQRQKNASARIKERAVYEDGNEKRMLNEIDTCDIMKNMVFILVFTDQNHTSEVRNRALAKIKTHPQWQQELVKRLTNDWAPEAFTFLASNPVDNPELFREPLKEGILIQAKLIRESIRRSSHPSHFYPEQFGWEVERVLRTADRFKDSSHNYVAEVKQLRAALDEPTEIDKPDFKCGKYLEKWISRNSQ